MDVEVLKDSSEVAAEDHREVKEVLAETDVDSPMNEVAAEAEKSKQTLEPSPGLKPFSSFISQKFL